jgi:hypothetical protein
VFRCYFASLQGVRSGDIRLTSCSPKLRIRLLGTIWHYQAIRNYFPFFLFLPCINKNNYVLSQQVAGPMEEAPRWHMECHR